LANEVSGRAFDYFNLGKETKVVVNLAEFSSCGRFPRP